MSSFLSDVPDRLVIDGPMAVGGRISLQGSKNSALSLIPTLLLAEGKSTLGRVPDLVDTRRMISFIESLGIEASFADGTLRLNAKGALSEHPSIRNDHVARIRSTYYFIPYFLKNFGEVILPCPGGCNIGERKDDFLFDALESFGASVRAQGNGVEITAPMLKGTEVTLPYPSQSASTILLSMAAVSEGRTVLRNLSLNPEIDDKLALLKVMGVELECPEPRVVVVSGTGGREGPEPVRFNVMPDRIAAATWIAFSGAGEGGWVEMSRDAEPYMQSELEAFGRLGLVTEETGDGYARYSFNGPPSKVAIETGPYPKFSTDIQPFALTLMACRGAKGSIVRELVFDKRFGYVDYLNTMGADIRVTTDFSALCPNGRPSQIAEVFANRRKRFAADRVVATDLRSGMALVMAACAADGRSIIENTVQIYRGYEHLKRTLGELNIEVKEDFDEMVPSHG